MIRDLLLPITHTAGDESALASALACASQFGAHLAVIEPVLLPVPVLSPWDVSPGVLMEGLYAEIRQRSKDNAAQLRKRLDKEAIASDVRVYEGQLFAPWHAVALQARYADMAVIAAPGPNEDAVFVRNYLAGLLFESGRPVLVVPAGCSLVLPIRHAVVAWQPTREATRALHDALPLLQQAQSVDVLTVGPIVSETRHGEDPGVDIATHLARHALTVNVISRPAPGAEPVAYAILRHAHESGAQLIVAGGYGHSRLHEWLFGGTTRELLEVTDLPILFAH